MQGEPVHGVDAVFDHHYGVVARAGRAGGREHAAVGVHAGDEDRVDAVRAQHEIEVGPDEAIVALLRVDDPVSLRVEQLWHDGDAGHAGEVVLEHVRARIVRVARAREPRRHGGDLLGVAVLREQMHDRDAGGAATLEKARVGCEHARGAVGRERHGCDGRVEVPAVQVDGDDRRYRPVYSQVHFFPTAYFQGMSEAWITSGTPCPPTERMARSTSFNPNLWVVTFSSGKRLDASCARASSQAL